MPRSLAWAASKAPEVTVEDGADLEPEPLWWCLGPAPEEDEEDEVPCLSLLSFPEEGLDPPSRAFLSRRWQRSPSALCPEPLVSRGL